MRTKKELVPQKLSTLSNLDAEMCLIGCVLFEEGKGEASEQIFSDVNIIDFYYEEYQKIFQIMQKLFSEGKGVDLVSVSEMMTRQYQGWDIKSLITCLDVVIGNSNFANYLKIVKDYSNLRKTENICYLGQDLVRSSKTAESAIAFLQDELLKISEVNITSDCEQVSDIADKTFDRIKKRANGEYDEFGLRTGFGCLDRCLWGLQKSDLIIVAARPGVGKTAFVLNVINHAATTNQKKVAFFSLEMPKNQIVERLFSIGTGIPNYDLKSGRIEKKFKDVSEFKEKLKNSKLFIDDDPNNTVPQMLLKAKRLQRKEGLDLVVIDYLQFIKPAEKSGNRVQDVGEIARGLKNMARQLNVPVLVPCQLSRQTDKNEGLPVLADLRESGEIENNADIVMFLDLKSGRSEEEKDIDAILGKFRNGQMKTIRMSYRGECFKFKEKDKASPQKHEQLKAELTETHDELPF